MDLKVPISGAPGAGEQNPIAKKCGNLSIIRENLVMTSVYDRTLTVQTLGKGEGSQESGVSPSGEEYVIAEVKFCASSTPLNSAVNHMAARTFREKKKDKKKPRIFGSTKF